MKTVVVKDSLFGLNSESFVVYSDWKEATQIVDIIEDDDQIGIILSLNMMTIMVLMDML
jgi:hypothetical protein